VQEGGTVALWVIGDVHGCWRTLQRLLDRIGWEPARDRLWLIGDLVNKGPDSLAVLRWAARQPGVDSILGNHDLHLLARAAGLGSPRSDDRLEEVLDSDDRVELLEWLLGRPFLHRAGDTVLVHAGLMPEWGIGEAERLAAEASARLRDLLPKLTATPRPVWGSDARGDDRLAAAVGIFTRVRVIRGDGTPKLGYAGALEAVPNGTRPWFEAARILREAQLVIFGHWAMMGFRRCGRAVCLDSGCVYGGSLTAIRLDGEDVVQVPLEDSVEV
jgi:bis(5'-nucleosyl)-tetraphosphatase (symmetrical)